MNSITKLYVCFLTGILLLTGPLSGSGRCEKPVVSDNDLSKALAFEQQRISAIEQVVNSVVAIYDEDRSGGGSGVVITPSGLALTNHHVIVGAGVEGWGGMAGNKIYKWELIGTDPGGDVSLIQMFPREEDGDDFQFPFTPLGDSDQVQVGDWALAMGNPFILTEDQSPTVTFGIVSGVKRYQSGAGKNQLVYGNCIQVDSSINPGNSGGPLFNLNGRVIGINGRGSFQDRGRVNVGLGYAISANQIKNFVPELLATKLVEHGTLDANFSDRDGKVLCSTLSSDSPAADAGLELGDEMLEFEGEPIETANEFTNLICTLPEGWPAELKVRKPNGSELAMTVRLPGLPYARPRRPRVLDRKPKEGEKDKPPTEKEKKQMRQMELVRVMSAEPGTVRKKKVNRRYVTEWLSQWQPSLEISKERCWILKDTITNEDGTTEPMTMGLCADGRFWVESETFAGSFDGEEFRQRSDGEKAEDEEAAGPTTEIIAPEKAKLQFEFLQAITMAAGFTEPHFSAMGDILIDGADRCAGQRAVRFSVANDDDDPMYFWITGIPYAEKPMRLKKCAATMDSDDCGVMLENWQSVADDAKGVVLPMTRKRVSGIEEKSTATITNDSISELSFEEFEEQLKKQTNEDVDSKNE